MRLNVVFEHETCASDPIKGGKSLGTRVAI